MSWYIALPLSTARAIFHRYIRQRSTVKNKRMQIYDILCTLQTHKSSSLGTKFLIAKDYRHCVQWGRVQATETINAQPIDCYRLSQDQIALLDRYRPSTFLRVALQSGSPASTSLIIAVFSTCSLFTRRWSRPQCICAVSPQRFPRDVKKRKLVESPRAVLCRNTRNCYPPAQ